MNGNSRPHLVLLSVLAFSCPPTAEAQDEHCDPAYQNCRTPLIQLIRSETVGIDVAQWFMRDTWIIDELIKKHQAGVPIRFIMDRRGEGSHEGSIEAIMALRDAGIPMREKKTGGIVHWKLFIFAGQHIVKFGAANLVGVDYVPVDPYKHYRNESHIINRSQVDSFKTKFEDKWLSTSLVDYAHITEAHRVRKYPITPIDTAHLSFQPEDAFSSRLVSLIDKETEAIDVSLLRLGLSSLTNALVRAHQRGVKVRVNSEQAEYRDTLRYQHAHALDQLHVAGIAVRWRAHIGQNHEKTALFHGQKMMWTGSSNWVASSDRGGNMEHNYFTDPTQTDWWDHYYTRFERRWYNQQFIDGVQVLESQPFVPQPPAKAAYSAPANGFVGTPTALVFNGGYYGFFADVYFGTLPNPPLYQADVPLATNTKKTVPLPVLTPGKIYYWRIVNKTLANKVSFGPVYSFRVPDDAATTNVAPAVRIANPAAQSTSTAPATFSIVADTSDADGAISGVEFFANGTLIGTRTAAPWNVMWSGVAEGSYSLTARATDNLNATTTSETVSVSVTAASPTATEIVLYAADAPTIAGDWQIVADASAAGGRRLQNPNAGAAKLSTPLAEPTSYFELTFVADAGRPYRLWMRGTATANSWANDSAYVQFDQSVSESGAAVYRIGTTSATTYTLEDCVSCGVAGWGWQDDMFGAGAWGPPIYFANSGPQRIRIQVREDGLGIDQVVLSGVTYLSSAPGALKNDSTILPR